MAFFKKTLQRHLARNLWVFFPALDLKCVKFLEIRPKEWGSQRRRGANHGCRSGRRGNPDIYLHPRGFVSLSPQEAEWKTKG
jgi:hypothetical protein